MTNFILKKTTTAINFFIEEKAKPASTPGQGKTENGYPGCQNSGYYSAGILGVLHSAHLSCSVGSP